MPLIIKKIKLKINLLFFYTRPPEATAICRLFPEANKQIFTFPKWNHYWQIAFWFAVHNALFVFNFIRKIGLYYITLKNNMCIRI